jgi:hypothetical protein
LQCKTFMSTGKSKKRPGLKPTGQSSSPWHAQNLGGTDT